MKNENEKLNHKAYLDVLDCKEPSMPNNKLYMQYYTFWRPLQIFPGDENV